MLTPLRMLFDMLRDSPAFFEGFSAAAQASFGQVGKAWRAVLRGDFSAAGEELASIGGAAGRAYLKAFDAARASRPAEATATTAAGGEEPDGNKPGAGGDGTTQAERDKAAKEAQAAREKARKEAKAARDKADQEHLNGLKKLVQDELVVLSDRDALRAQRELAGYNDELRRRDQQRQKLFDAAAAQVDKLTGLENDYSQRVEAIMQERDLSLRELQAGFDEESAKRKQEQLDQKIAQGQAEQEQALAELDLQLTNGVLNEWAFQDAVYAVKQAALERELALVKLKNGEESAEYKALQAEKLRNQADFIASRKGMDEGLYKMEKGITAAHKLLGSEEFTALTELLGKKTLVYKAAMAAQKALTIAEIGMGVVKQFASNAEAGAKIAAMAPPVSIPLGTAYTVGANILASATAGAAVAKVLGIGFRQGGPTGSAPVGEGAGLAGLRIGTSGKLLDAEGFAVAGVVHENEYVIPEWMRADLKVVQIEQFLEQKRLRGYIEGGATSGNVTVPAAGTGAAPETEVQLLLLAVLGRLDLRLVDVEQWARDLNVVLDVYGLEQTFEERDATRKAAEIR
ncbi:hypothetical protein Hsw_2113 [Hymenobacter swuensis DY53]|uniref:Uncharacterized protein n=2 Tax=Hymenobacter TaxID=89966 RepID=W8EYN3_9BACT|nr:hypothetical protein Hsw_2113 [Hymenobacter swuensis DY53]